MVTQHVDSALSITSASRVCTRDLRFTMTHECMHVCVCVYVCVCACAGIPVYNVNNNCATGSTALYMAYQFIAGGLNDCVVALGFEKMVRTYVHADMANTCGIMRATYTHQFTKQSSLQRACMMYSCM